MSPLFGPILAQLVTMSVFDRTEARHTRSDVNYSEVATYPRVTLDVGWKQGTLRFAYLPAITITPLEADSPSAIVLQSGAVALSNRWQRTTVTAGEWLSYGEVSPRNQGLAPGSGPVVTLPAMSGAASGGSTGNTTTTGNQQQGGPTLGGTNQIAALDKQLKVASSVSTLEVSQAYSAALTVSGQLFYMFFANPGEDQERYPTVQGPGARLAVTYAATARDRLSTYVSSQSGFGNNGNNSWLMYANESWAHDLDKQTVSTLGFGLSMTRNSQPNGLIYYTIFPNFNAALIHTSRLGRNTLTVGTTLTSAPYIDPVLAQVDPRITASALIGFNAKRFSAFLTASTAVSIPTEENASGLNALYGTLQLNYRFGKNFAIDGGMRGSWQTFGGQTTIPPSLAFFVGVSVGAQASSIR